MTDQTKQPEAEVEIEEAEINPAPGTEPDEDSGGTQDAGIDDDIELEDDEPVESKTNQVTREILLERENAAIKERLSFLDRQASQAQNQQAEQERLSLMSAEEKAQYIFDKTRSFISEKEQALDRKLQFANFDMQDRAQFSSKYGNHTAYNKLAAQVETKYNDVASKGNPVSRKDIFTWMLGQKQLQAIERGTGKKQMNKGVQNVQKSKSNGQAGKSDFQKAAPPKGNDFSAIKARLEKGRGGYLN